jgi:hypothetical protein
LYGFTRCEDGVDLEIDEAAPVRHPNIGQAAAVGFHYLVASVKPIARFLAKMPKLPQGGAQKTTNDRSIDIRKQSLEDHHSREPKAMEGWKRLSGQDQSMLQRAPREIMVEKEQIEEVFHNEVGTNNPSTTASLPERAAVSWQGGSVTRATPFLTRSWELLAHCRDACPDAWVGDRAVRLVGAHTGVPQGRACSRIESHRLFGAVAGEQPCDNRWPQTWEQTSWTRHSNPEKRYTSPVLPGHEVGWVAGNLAEMASTWRVCVMLSNLPRETPSRK